MAPAVRRLPMNNAPRSIYPFLMKGMALSAETLSPQLEGLHRLFIFPSNAGRKLIRVISDCFIENRNVRFSFY
jgi:hypothetical protein